MHVPRFLLKKLYVKNSLKNTDNGFQFTIKNTLVDGTVISPVTVVVDNTFISPQDITLTVNNTPVAAATISKTTTMLLPVDVEVFVVITGDLLPAGEHTLEIACTTKEFGDIKFSITDSVESS